MTGSFWTKVCLTLALVTGNAFSAQAHEFWLAPEDFTVEDGAQLNVAWRNGQKFEGVDIPYLPAGPVRFEVVMGDTATPYVGRLGDTPALMMPAPGSGLAVVVLETIDTLLTYDDFAKFQRFTEHKALTQILDQHAARGIPQTLFTESYRRFCKSLIAVGEGAGADRNMGLRIEIVALANPYTDDMTGGMPLLVLLDGAPRPAVQLQLFAIAPDGTVTETNYTTDAEGKVTVPALSGHIYLADNVDLYALPNNDIAKGPVWHSDWASLTYMVP